MTMTRKINKLEKPGGPQGNFYALFGRSPTFYGHFWADAVMTEWSTRISSSWVASNRDVIWKKKYRVSEKKIAAK